MTYRRLTLFPVPLANFLSSRTCSINLCQSISGKVLKRLEDNDLPPRPKKPLSSFLLFVQSVRPQLLKENPDCKLPEISKKAAVAWASLNPTEKEEYQARYKKSHESYLKELTDYENSLTDEQREQLKQKEQIHKQNREVLQVKQKVKMLGKPRRPMSAFFLYLNSNNDAKDGSISVKNWVVSRRDSWKKMTDKEKEKYYTQADELMKQYLKDMDVWEKKMVELGHSDVIRRNGIDKSKKDKSK